MIWTAKLHFSLNFATHILHTKGLFPYFFKHRKILRWPSLQPGLSRKIKTDHEETSKKVNFQKEKNPVLKQDTDDSSEPENKGWSIIYPILRNNQALPHIPGFAPVHIDSG